MGGASTRWKGSEQRRKDEGESVRQRREGKGPEIVTIIKALRDWHNVNLLSLCCIDIAIITRLNGIR